ncbi:unnamed protein product [Lepeophtheirus salmonis]|uniref:(salmon louse) hypothetical protein n=1 Tax=Lepeophtheirus salmonis TaxID=72036 RepID=A0A7R8CYJ8_LEPSM|nr:unnamed protein product [Lepeophtheirus salmonis]CAF2969136.1 unnamed protein product [Lepeophtheirus salmonis]
MSKLEMSSYALRQIERQITIALATSARQDEISLKLHQDVQVFKKLEHPVISPGLSHAWGCIIQKSQGVPLDIDYEENIVGDVLEDLEKLEVDVNAMPQILLR